MNKFFPILLIVSLCVYGCKEKKNITKAIEISFFDYSPKTMVYDTLNGIFYYENYIESYFVFDAITKSSGFIKGDEISKTNYQNGYYIFQGADYFKKTERENIFINYNYSSISAFHDSLFYEGMRTNTFNNTTDINPYCHSYYKKFYFEIEVVFIDTILQKTPLFMDCIDFERFVQNNNGQNYQFEFLPTYLITEIFYWKAL